MIRRTTSHQLWRRLDRLAQQCPKPAIEDTPEAQRAWLLAHGYDPTWQVIGLTTGRGVVVLPALVEPRDDL